MRRLVRLHARAIVLLALLCSEARQSVCDAAESKDWTVVSPSGEVSFHLMLEDAANLRYNVRFGTQNVIESSHLGIVVDDAKIGLGADVKNVERYTIDEQYSCRGVHSTATNRCRGATFLLGHRTTNCRCSLEVRAFDDGVAFRFIVPGTGARTPDAAIEFTIPPGSIVWRHDLRNHYEGTHIEERVESISVDQWIAPPMTFRLPRDGGYASITEAGLQNYAGMAIQADENRVFRERLGHSHPRSHPFELRFNKEEGDRLSRAASVDGEIVTPWRVIIVGHDLNTLVNCDIVQNVSPAPDNRLFPDGINTSWIKPGRSVWKFLDGGENSLHGMMDFSRSAGQLGFEYNLVEGFWQRWTKQELQSLVDYSNKFGVGIWLWKDSRSLRTPEDRARFFALCSETGVVGVKIDFFDHEAKEVVDLYQTLLVETAKNRLMVSFHGANKPTGETRTWPNELTREAIRGLEARNIKSRSAHDATLPFTRYLAGPGDYTPVIFGPRRGDTTAAHQLATAVVFTSPLLVYGANPASLLEHPAREMIKTIPSLWDETIVLPISDIGRVAAFARRSGDHWFLAVVGGPEGKKLRVPLSFLKRSRYSATLISDAPSDATSVAIESRIVNLTDSLEIELGNGGGFLGQFSR